MHSVHADRSKVSDTIVSEVRFSPLKMGVVLKFWKPLFTPTAIGCGD